MKIQVVIEATSIEEYTEAIQALAAGYTVAPAPKIELVASSKAAETVDSDEVKVAEEKPNRVRKAVEKTVNPDETQAETIEEIKKAAEEYRTKEKTEPTKTETSKHGFPAVKLIASKLSKITDGKAEVKFLLDKFGAAKLSELKEENYDEFHELASKSIAEHDNVTPVTKEDAKPAKEVETKEDKSEKKEITIENIRGIAKQLSEQGFKDEIRKTLKDFGATSLTKIKKADYPAFYEALVAYNG